MITSIAHFCRSRLLANLQATLSKTLRRIKILALISLIAGAARAGQVGLEWDPNTEPDLGGYTLYMATFSLLNKSTDIARKDDRVAKIVISTRTTADVPLHNGVTFYFRLTASDTWYNESGFNVKSATEPVADEVKIFYRRADVNGDGAVDVLDLGILTKEWDQ